MHTTETRPIDSRADKFLIITPVCAKLSTPVIKTNVAKRGKFTGITFIALRIAAINSTLTLSGVTLSKMMSIPIL